MVETEGDIMKVTARKSTVGRRARQEMREGLALEPERGEQLCRACLRARPIRESVNLFARWKPPWRGSEDVCVASELAALAHIHIEVEDKYPVHICMTCFESFTDMFSFLYNVRQSDQIMRNNEHMFNGDTAPDLLHLRQSKSFEGSEDLDDLDEIKQEVLSDTMDVDPEELRLVEETIKIEPEEVFQPSHILNGHHEQGDDVISSDIVISNIYSINTMDAPPPSTDNPLLVQRFSKAINSTKKIPITVKQEPLDIEQQEYESDLSLDCLLCNKSLKTITGLKAHVISSHSYKTITKKSKMIKDNHRGVKEGKIMKTKNKRQEEWAEVERKPNVPTCIVCCKVFLSMKSLRNHERVHNTGCIYCQAHFTSFLTLANHMEICPAKHGNTSKSLVPKPKTVQQLRRSTAGDSLVEVKKRKLSTENKEVFMCSVCSEKFEESIYLKIHNEIHHTNFGEVDDEEEEDKHVDLKDTPTAKESKVVEEICQVKSDEVDGAKILDIYEVSAQKSDEIKLGITDVITTSVLKSEVEEDTLPDSKSKINSKSDAEWEDKIPNTSEIVSHDENKKTGNTAFEKTLEEEADITDTELDKKKIQDIGHDMENEEVNRLESEAIKILENMDERREKNETADVQIALEEHAQGLVAISVEIRKDFETEQSIKYETNMKSIPISEINDRTENEINYKINNKQLNESSYIKESSNQIDTIEINYQINTKQIKTAKGTELNGPVEYDLSLLTQSLVSNPESKDMNNVPETLDQYYQLMNEFIEESETGSNLEVSKDLQNASENIIGNQESNNLLVKSAPVSNEIEEINAENSNIDSENALMIENSVAPDDDNIINDVYKTPVIDSDILDRNNKESIGIVPEYPATEATDVSRDLPIITDV